MSADSPARYIARELILLETNLDDMNPEFFPGVLAQLLKEGARDCWITPIIMKRGRPAQCLSVLCEPTEVERLCALLFRETTTLGVRLLPVKRLELLRESVDVDTKHGVISVKEGRDNIGTVLNAAPELSQCEERARQLGVSVKEVYREAQSAYDRMRSKR